MFDDISDDPEMRAEVDQIKKERYSNELHAFLEIEDILAFLSPIKVLGQDVDAMVNAVVVHEGTDRLYVEDLHIVGWKIFVNDIPKSVSGLEDDFEIALMRQLREIARDLAAKTEEKYWEYR